jgi:ribosome modulation factor
MSKEKKKKSRIPQDYVMMEAEYQEGVQANLDGLCLDDCPYTFPLKDGQIDGQRKAWMDGWLNKRYEHHLKR